MKQRQAHDSDNLKPGVILLQIDGLARKQAADALQKGRMPFLQSLIDSDACRLRSFYSGLPSATPAVQGELFFNEPGAVPAVRYISRENGEDCLTLNPVQLKPLAARLFKNRRGLLEGGASYSNIYTGGAMRARYCIEVLDPATLIKGIHPPTTLWSMIQHFGKLFRIAGLTLVEIALSIKDFLSGGFKNNQFLQELKFIPARIWVCIVMRELIRFRVKLDIRTGVPILCANFVGYDEHAHRRGPGSAFAHWTLKGIDGVVRDIYRHAQKSRHRNYRVIIYSDHGQESVVPYSHHYNQSLSKALKRAFANGPLAGTDIFWTEESISNIPFLRRSRRLLKRLQKDGGSGEEIRIVVTAMGPLGHIYLPGRVSDDDRAEYARQIVHAAGIPLLFYRAPRGRTLAVNTEGSHDLIDEHDKYLGPDHPFPEQTAHDLKRLVNHVDAGDFVISGWNPTGEALSFPIENGAHGGPGSQECEGFVLLPDELAQTTEKTLRPADLHRISLEILGRSGEHRE